MMGDLVKIESFNDHLPLNQVKTDMTVKQPIARVVSVEPGIKCGKRRTCQARFPTEKCHIIFWSLT